ncbi:hypothetical protein [Roseateles sp.]|uniref:hypothetical protein n=1 Tax=Roseateles sp. TaxID=1971397 RepID=UPI0031CF0FF2
MTATTLNAAPQVMAADFARAGNASVAGERVVGVLLRASRGFFRAVNTVAELRPRAMLLQAAEEQGAERPDLAFSLRRAARNGWMY